MLTVILKAVWKTTEIMLTCSVIRNKKVAMYTIKIQWCQHWALRKGIGKEKGNANWQESPEELAELFALQ